MLRSLLMIHGLTIQGIPAELAPLEKVVVYAAIRPHRYR
jgi:hypothetical protein